MKNLIVIGLLVVGVGALAVFGFNLGAEPVKGDLEKLSKKSFTNEYGVTVAVDDTPVIDAPGIEGQGYITQPDGTITIFLK